MAARSWVPGLSAVVCTEKGGPLSPDQVSNRQVTATAIRARLGHVNPFDFSVMADTWTFPTRAAPGHRATSPIEHFRAALTAATSRRFVAAPIMAYDRTVLQEAAARGRRPYHEDDSRS